MIDGPSSLYIVFWTKTTFYRNNILLNKILIKGAGRTIIAFQIISNFCASHFWTSIAKKNVCIVETIIIYSPTKVKHHLTCFNNIFSNNELISNRFAVFATCTHILTYLWNRLLIDFYLCVYDRVCKVPHVLCNICVCERKLIFFV
jgi:hypothetical protein